LAGATPSTNDLSIFDQCPADAGTEGQHGGVAHSSRGAKRCLSDERHIAVIVENDRSTESIPEHSLKRHSGQVDVPT
jgi:hypothetical protein